MVVGMYMTAGELCRSTGPDIECRASYVPIVQWIERGPPKTQMQVRFLLGTPRRRFTPSQIVLNQYVDVSIPNTIEATTTLTQGN